MRYLLSIHDVWPGNHLRVEAHHARLKALGVPRIALMVVPCYHGRRPMEGEGEFLAWLREKAAGGAEIFLHGFRHLAPERVEDGAGIRRSAWGRWVNRRLVGGEAEFCGLDPAHRARLLELGMGSFRASGIRAEGFVAPTWYGAPPRARLREAGLRLWETRFRLHDLGDGAARFAPPLSWAPPAAGRDAVLFGGRPWLEALLRLPLIKVALHPGDLDGRGVEGTLERVVAAGRGVSYREAMAAG